MQITKKNNTWLEFILFQPRQALRPTGTPEWEIREILIPDTTPSPPLSGAGSSGTPPALLRRNGYAKAREGEKYSTNK